MPRRNAEPTDAPAPATRARRRGGAVKEAAKLRAFARERDGDLRDELIRTYLPLARSLARRFTRRHSDLHDDLNQVAALGLVKAIDRYDPRRGTAFSSFAVPTIEGELRRYLRDHTWSVRPPRDLQEHSLAVARDRDYLHEVLGRTPTAGEVAEWQGCSVEDVVEAIAASDARVSDSLERPLFGDDDASLGDLIGCDDDGFARADARASLAPLLDRLSEREQAVVLLYLGADMTQLEIGRRLGCSQMHVSRIYRGAVAKLTALVDERKAA